MSTDRTAYTAGLRALADLLDADQDLPLPYTGRSSAVAVFTDTPEEAAKWGAALSSRTVGCVTGSLHGLQVVVYRPAMPGTETKA